MTETPVMTWNVVADGKVKPVGEVTIGVELPLWTLRARGFAPKFAVDVGAYRGNWTRMFKAIYPQCEVLMVEPMESEAATLRQLCDELPGIGYSSALLSTRRESLRFVEMKSGSSVLEERSPYPRMATVRQATTLDHLISRPVDLLKLDVQGYELAVLRGGMGTLANCKAVIVEASLLPINQGAPLLPEVVAFMAGWRLIDIFSPIRRADGALWQVDLLFVREGPLVPKPELTAENWGTAATVKDEGCLAAYAGAA